MSRSNSPKFVPGDVVKCVSTQGCQGALTAGKTYLVMKVVTDNAGGWLIGVIDDEHIPWEYDESWFEKAGDVTFGPGHP